MLAAAVPARAGMQIAELGTGSAVAALCLLARVPDCTVTAVERDGGLVALAERNLAANARMQTLRLLHRDVRDLPADRSLAGAFDEVFANPPFHDRIATDPSPDESRRGATLDQDLDLWIDAAAHCLKRRGGLTVIFRADRLDTLLTALRPRFGGSIVMPLWPKAGRPAKRVILHARLGDRSAMTLSPGLVLHEADGRYTAAAETILRDGASLPGFGA